MRLLHFSFLIAAFPFLVLASEERKETCKGVSGVAMKIMEARQAGVPVSDLLDKLQQAGNDQWVYELVKLAYREPGYSTEQNKKKAITEFGNSAFISCVE